MFMCLPPPAGEQLMYKWVTGRKQEREEQVWRRSWNTKCKRHTSKKKKWEVHTCRAMKCTVQRSTTPKLTRYDKWQDEVSPHLVETRSKSLLAKVCPLNKA
mmetsp:Transcript_74453/g.155218  ORF Transcript_74453/g.155218 Transcript_74453/m.155218 type:complete len:101 (+) Transcript_74453:192-494(+)